MAVPTPVTELYLNGAWTDVSAFVYVRDGIGVGEGGDDPSRAFDPSNLTLTFDNRDGRFSPRNAVSPYYPHLRRNTPVRVSPGAGDPVSSGYVAQWPVDWSPDGGDVYAQIEAAGPRRRLAQGTALRSSMYREVTRRAAQDVHIREYWPCEEQRGATTITSALGGSDAIFGVGLRPTFGDYESVNIGSDPILRLHSSVVSFPVRNYSSAIQEVGMIFHADPDGPDGQTLIVIESSGTLARTQLAINTTGFLRREFFDDGGGSHSVGTGTIDLRGRDWLLRVSLRNVGADMRADINAYPLDVTDGSFLFYTSLVAGLQIGRITEISIAQDDYPCGHVALITQTSSFAGVVAAAQGWRGESAAERLERLCDEENLGFAFVGDLDPHFTTAMGKQRSGELLTLMDECVTVDLGLLHEDPVPGAALVEQLRYVSRQHLYEAPIALTLDYDAGDMVAAPVPVDDDQNLVNDVTAARPDGGSARAVLAAGPLSIQPPPDGLGSYDDSVDVNVFSDLMLPHQASMRLHIGTLDRPRYPVIAVELASEPWASPARTDEALATVIGDRIRLLNLPGWLPPDPVDLIVIGRTLTWDDATMIVQWSCVPYELWRAAAYQADPPVPDDETQLVRYDAFDSTTFGQRTATETQFTVQVHGFLARPGWVTTADQPDQFPFDIDVGGERMTVTAITFSVLNGHNFTVVRSVNGIVKAQPSGTPVHIWEPQRYMLGEEG